MSSVEVAPVPFAHEAVFYDDDAGYVALARAFVEEGLDLGQPILVAVPRANLDLLRPWFGPAAASLLRFEDMEAMGRNPAWIIPAWAEFVRPHLEAGRPARGIGQPVWAARTDDELVECGRHESLLNLAFAGATGFRLLCPYDTRTLARPVLDEARRNHPHVGEGGVLAPSPTYDENIPEVLDAPLAPAPATAAVVAFGRRDITKVRRRAAEVAAAAGLPRGRVHDAALAVCEAATNTVRHAGGEGEIALWHHGARFFCDVRDRGRIADPLAGRICPPAEQPGGRGLWLMHQLCDLVQIRRSHEGQVVRLQLA